MGQPAARLADPGLHVKGAGVILQGCASVRIEGRLAARQGDEIQHNQHVEVITLIFLTTGARWSEAEKLKPAGLRYGVISEAKIVRHWREHGQRGCPNFCVTGS